MNQVRLPRGRDREHVHHRDRHYTLRGSETRTLTTVGAFRAVRAADLRDASDRPLDPRHGELWHLRESGLVHTVRMDRDNTVVTLTKEGRDLLEARRLDEHSPDRQAFYHGVQKPRELKHDAHLYRAYMDEAEQLRDDGAQHPPHRPRKRPQAGVPGVPPGTQSQGRRQRRTSEPRSR